MGIKLPRPEWVTLPQAANELAALDEDVELGAVRGALQHAIAEGLVAARDAPPAEEWRQGHEVDWIDGSVYFPRPGIPVTLWHRCRPAVRLSDLMQVFSESESQPCHVDQPATPDALPSRGRPKTKGDGILEEMRKLSSAELKSMLGKEMEQRFGAARNTCAGYRRKVLAERERNS